MIHICNNFISSKVHGRLISALSQHLDNQKVVVPIRRSQDYGKYNLKEQSVEVIYIRFSSAIVRFFPIVKILYLFAKCFKTLGVSRQRGYPVEPLLAHNFWSDGMIAFLYSFFKPLNYVLVIRNTDINIFIPNLPHYRWLMRVAVRRSACLVFVSKAHFLRVQEKWPEIVASARQVKVIPNGISDFWIENRVTEISAREEQACFVGRFDRNKNLARVVEAATAISRVRPDFRLVLVGGTSKELKNVLGLDIIPDFVEVKGVLGNEQLLDVYRKSRVFVMPSITETFGLVYIEALSQGCAVICSKNEGIDGIWDVPFVSSVNPKSVEEIHAAMITLLENNTDGLSPEWVNEMVCNYQWKEIAKQYLECFE